MPRTRWWFIENWLVGCQNVGLHVLCPNPVFKWVFQILFTSQSRWNVWLPMGNHHIFTNVAQTPGILIPFCWKLLKSWFDTFLRVFWPVLIDLSQFEIDKNFDFLGEKGEKSFSRSQNLNLWGCIIPTTIWKHIYNISKVQIRREKKVTDSVLDVRFFQNILWKSKVRIYKSHEKSWKQISNSKNASDSDSTHVFTNFD